MGKAIDLTGQKIGKLTIQERKREGKRTYYYCLCECHNKVWIRSDRLKAGTKSCGCLAKETQFKSIDIANQSFGRLIAVKPTNERDKGGAVIWECLCKCGNTTYVPYGALVKKEVVSCGCYGKEVSKNNIKKAIKKHLKIHIVEGTNVPAIARKSLKSNNTSGATGVMWDKSRNKWVSSITFKKKVYHLGRYENKEDAIKIRKEAEENLFGPFLEWYNENFNKGD